MYVQIIEPHTFHELLLLYIQSYSYMVSLQEACKRYLLSLSIGDFKASINSMFKSHVGPARPETLL